MMRRSQNQFLPFTSIVGQGAMKRALILNAVNPAIGGVLIRGDKGTAKSTTVRALAALLPGIRVISGCPFSCDPDDMEGCCENCSGGSDEANSVLSRPVRIVTLPLGATEDRVIGTLDLKRAVKEGITALDPGILAAVHRGILYIDEVNLLEDHIIDILLDAAAMGINTIEREGVSVSHPSRFILIGTMNPEEGELRPQLLDRFGLMVTVSGMTDPEERMAVVRAAEAWDTDPEKVQKEHDTAIRNLREEILRAQAMIEKVTVSEMLIRHVVDACLTLGIATHRAEITVIRTAKTIAACEGREIVTAEDLREAMALALPHRMRRKPFEEPRLDPEVLDEMIPDSPGSEDDSDAGSERDAGDSPPEGEGDGRGGQGEAKQHGIGAERETEPLWETLPTERDLRRRSHGRRIETPTTDPRNRKTTIRTASEWRGIAIDATIRAASAHQPGRERNGNALVVLDEDLRRAQRRGRAEVACLFVVDASGSMGADERMGAAKGAVFSLLQDAYINRDRVGLVAFRGNSADLVLPLSRSPELAVRRLQEIPTGGRTPLAAGLQKGVDLLSNEMRKQREIIPMMMLISDGRANVGDGPIREELGRIADNIAASGIRTVVIDTEAATNGQSLSLGYCQEIARRSHGSYYPISELSSGRIGSIARDERNLWNPM